MPQEILTVEELTSQARNPTRGQTEKGLLPHRAFNLVPGRAGGLTAFGYRNQMREAPGGPQAPPLTINTNRKILGIDESGISSFQANSGEYALYRGRQIVASHYVYTQPREAVHLDSAGAYSGRESFFVYSREIDGVRIPVEPIKNAAATAITVAGSPVGGDDADWEGWAPRDMDYANGVYIMVTADAIWKRSGEDGTWDKVLSNPLQSSTNGFSRVAYGHGVWMVAQSSDPNTMTAWRSEDDGDSWAAFSMGSPGLFSFIKPGIAPGSWLAGASLSSGGGFLSQVAYSTNNGAIWSNFSSGNASYSYLLTDAVAYDSDWMFIVQNFPETPGKMANIFVSKSTEAHYEKYYGWAANQFVPVTPTDQARNAYRTHPAAMRAVITHTGRIVVISLDGPVSYFDPIARAQYQKVSHTPGITETNITVYDAVYDPVGNVIVAVGSTSSHEGRVWLSGDEGLTWTRAQDIEDAIGGPVYTVAVDDAGNALYLGADRWAKAGTTRGLAGGTYNVYIISYFNTHAGKFVYDMRTLSLSTSDGGSLEFYAPTKANILADNAPANGGWITPTWASIVDDLRFDVYIQSTREPIAGEDVAYTIRYAFTSPFPEAGDPPDPGDPGDDPEVDPSFVGIGRTIEQLPLGRHLITNGLPTTAVFEKRHTALHNGRIWGLALQDEIMWPDDVASPEIANQNQRFVLSYTEVGWANLISDRSFIVIQPSQSNSFTGILSTPSGLLVMFENEIYLVTGDPAFGDVSVELYLDMVGHDAPKPNQTPDDIGPRPIKVGGVPFALWGGKVWVLQAGQAQELGEGQWLREDPFVRIAPEPQTRSVLALTESGQVFRYLLDHQYWFTDPATVDGVPVREFFTNCSCGTGDNTRFMIGNGDLYSTRTDMQQPPATPHVLYLDVDFGALDARSSLYVVKAGFEGPILASEFDRNAGGFSRNVPLLTYRAANETNANSPNIEAFSHSTSQGRLPYFRPSGGRRSNTLAWRLPLGRVRGSSVDVRLDFAGFGYEDAFKLPLQLVFARSGVLR